MEPPAGRDPATIKNHQVALWRAVGDADPAHYVRGQYDGYLDIDGVAPESTTETYAALRLEIDNWRWSGVPFFIRTGKRLPATQTEFRLIFKRPPRLGLQPSGPQPEPNQLVVRLDPSTGIRFDLDARRADAASPESVTLDMEFAARRAARGRRRTRCCCTRRWSATAPGSPGRTVSRRGGGSCSRCSTRRRRSTPTRPGTWGPAAADTLVAGHPRGTPVDDAMTPLRP